MEDSKIKAILLYNILNFQKDFIILQNVFITVSFIQVVRNSFLIVAKLNKTINECSFTVGNLFFKQDVGNGY